MKNDKPAIVVLMLAILMSPSCTRQPDCFQQVIFCAALVTDTLGINDHGINQDAWAGLEGSKANGIADQIAFIESVDPRDYDKNITYFAQRRYDLIITSGVGLRDETLRAAGLYPDSVFVGINQPQQEVPPNLFSITFAEDQMGFLAGALAARLSETHIVAAICETSGIDSMWRYCEGFRAGALHINQAMKILVEYRDQGSQEKLFIDEAWGRDRAQYFIKRGADIIFAVGGSTGQGALRAASEAGIYAIGAERDQAVELGQFGSGVVTSVYGRAAFEVRAVLRSIQAGNPIEPVLGQFGYVPLGDNIPESLSTEMDNLLSNLVSGYVQTNVPPQRP